MDFLISLFRQALPDGGRAFGDEEQETSSPAAIVVQCKTFLTKNMVAGSAFGYYYSFNRPSSYKYSASQWLWDDGAHMIAWVALGRKDLAINSLRAMQHFQLDDGRIPQQINWHYKKSWNDPFKPKLHSRHEYNDLTQMPVLPYSLRSIYDATGDIALLNEFVPKLVKYFKWWKSTRDLDDSGVLLEYPMKSVDHTQLIQLNLSYRYRYSWDQKAILGRTETASGPFNWFKVQDVAVNCVYASGWGVLGELANEYSPTLAAECYDNQKHAETGIIDTLFSKTAGYFVTGYKNNTNEQCFHNVRTVQILFPLLLNSLSPEQVDTIVRYLTDENEFWTPYPVPSVSKAEVEYNPILITDLLWRGPSWGFTNWFIMEGLQKYGRTAVLGELMDKWIAAAEKGGIWEMWNPETGVGYGAEGLGMSTLIVDWMKRLDRA